MSNKTLEIIGYDSSWGCDNRGCEDGPSYLPQTKIDSELKKLNINTKWFKELGIKNLAVREDIKVKEDSFPYLLQGLKMLSDKVKDAVNNNSTPVVIGGDHSSAIATWSSVVSELKANEKFGLIWLDAHMDAHTLETAHQGKWGGWWHGMPVSCLIGHGDDTLINLNGSEKKLSAEHISLIGIRSFESGEEEFLNKHKVRVYKMDEVKERGFDAIYKEALERAKKGTIGYGLSIDLDGIDPLYAPGVGTREKDGLNALDVLKTFEGIGYDDDLKAIEIVEYNPHEDEEDKTLKLTEDLIINFYKK